RGGSTNHERGRCAVYVARAYQGILGLLALAGVVYGIDGPGQGTAWIVFALAIGFEGVIQAILTTSSVSNDAAAARASASANDRKAIAEQLSLKAAAR